MKAIILLLLTTIAFLTPARGQNHARPKPAAQPKSGVFSGYWKGDEKCTVVSAPGTVLTVVTNGPNAVLVSGVYSTQGRLKGTLKDGVITILPQKVEDLNFANVVIAGNLSLSADRQNLVASFEIQNNETRDHCTATYHK